MVRRETDLDDEAYEHDVPISVTLGFNIFKLDSTSDDGKGKWCEAGEYTLVKRFPRGITVAQPSTMANSLWGFEAKDKAWRRC